MPHVRMRYNNTVFPVRRRSRVVGWILDHWPIITGLASLLLGVVTAIRRGIRLVIRGLASIAVTEFRDEETRQLRGRLKIALDDNSQLLEQIELLHGLQKDSVMNPTIPPKTT